MALRLFIYLLTGLTSSACFGQQIIFKTYTVQDGLVANPVRNIYQDSHGFIWVVTWEGLSKYDGHKFTNFTSGNGLSFDVINDVFEENNKLFVALNNRTIDIISGDRIKKAPSRGVTINRFYKKANQNTIAITDNIGIGTFLNGRLVVRTKQPLYSIQDFAELNDSISLVLDSDYKARLIDSSYRIFDGQKTTDHFSIAVDSKRNTWLCGFDGLKLLDTIQHRGRPIRYLPLPALFNHPLLNGKEVHRLFEDADGNYWITTLEGLVMISPQGRIRLFTVKNGLPTNFIDALFQDREKNIWLCTHLGLVKLVMKNNIEFFSVDDGLENYRVLSVIPHGKNSLLINNFTKILRIDLPDFSVKAFPVQKKSESMYRHDLKKGLVVLSIDEIWQTDEDGSYVKIAGVEPGNGFFSAALDRYGNVFAGTNHGIYIVQNGKPIRPLALKNRITTLNFDNEGNLWAGTWSSGLFKINLRYNNDSISISPKDMTHLVNELHIRSSFIDAEGNPWIGTRYKGAFKLKKLPGAKWQILNFNRDIGLSSNWINTFAEDSSGNIWIGCKSGLNKLIPEGKSYRIFDFSHLNNYFGEVFSIFPTAGKIIWTGTYTGLIRFRDDQVDTLPAPALAITSVFAGNTNIREKGQPTLNYKNNRIRFEFSAPGFINENSILYSYRLKGADTTWSIPSNQHSVSYASLKSGHYRFEIRAYGWDGRPGPPVSYSFTIRTPFRSTWWFITLCFLLLLGLVYSLYRYRISQLIKLQKVRNRIAIDLHDDIGSTLTNISILSELSNKTIEKPGEAKKYIQRITEEVSNSGQALDDIIWSVNSRNDTIEDMLVRMRRFAAELFDHTDARCRLQLQASAAGKKLNMEQKRDIYLIYKESLNNIYKHAKAAEISVELSMIKQVIKLVIEDNGIGFDPGLATTRNGLKNMNARVEKWKGSMVVHSGAGKGTRLQITIPVK